MQLRDTIKRLFVTVLKTKSLDTSGNVAVGGTLAVTGASTLTGAVTTTADLTVGTTLDVTGESTLGETVVNPVAALVDGAITAQSGTVYITKAGVAVLTLADPTSDNRMLHIVDASGNAHTIDNTAGSGFDGVGAGGDFATLGGAVGDGLLLKSVAGVWIVQVNKNATLS